MSVRKQTANRLTLFRTCHVCGKSIVTTADTPFVRQLKNVDGKKAKSCYFCSEKCKIITYKHLFDGHADDRRKMREAARDIKEKNYRYYHANEEAMRERSRSARAAMTPEERDKLNAYRRAKHRANREEDNRKRREYRAKKRAMADVHPPECETAM